MSLRAEFSGVDLPAIQRVQGSNDETIKARWLEAIDTAFGGANDRKLAAHSVDWLIKTPRDEGRLRVESESFAITVNALALLFQKVPPSTSSFFEQLAARISAERSRVEWFSEYRSVFRTGRPLFGDAFDSNWSYYSFLDLYDVIGLRDRIRDDEIVMNFHDAESGLAYLDRLVEAKAALWLFAS